MQLKPPFRPAKLSDAERLAELVNFAGEGMPLYLWEGMAEGDETAWDVGHKRAAREEGSFSYRNAAIIEHGGQAAGCLIGYAVPETPEPIASDLPAMFVPLQELEGLAPATWYVNILAVMTEFRGHGLGTELLALADATARDLGLVGVSLVVSDGNTGARRLYERCGYAETATRPMVKDDWSNPGQNWVLLVKRI
jgi:ribosomal protein S18 acetylase RimI-like enzyme